MTNYTGPIEGMMLTFIKGFGIVLGLLFLWYEMIQIFWEVV